MKVSKAGLKRLAKSATAEQIQQLFRQLVGPETPRYGRPAMLERALDDLAARFKAAAWATDPASSSGSGGGPSEVAPGWWLCPQCAEALESKQRPSYCEYCSATFAASPALEVLQLDCGDDVEVFLGPQLEPKRPGWFRVRRADREFRFVHRERAKRLMESELQFNHPSLHLAEVLAETDDHVYYQHNGLELWRLQRGKTAPEQLPFDVGLPYEWVMLRALEVAYDADDWKRIGEAAQAASEAAEQAEQAAEAAWTAKRRAHLDRLAQVDVAAVGTLLDGLASDAQGKRDLAFVVEQVKSVAFDDGSLKVRFGTGHHLEVSVPAAPEPQSWPSSHAQIIESIGLLYLVDESDGLPCMLYPDHFSWTDRLEGVDGPVLQASTTDHSDVYVYHPTLKNGAGEAALFYVSHEGGGVFDEEHRSERLIGDVFIGDVATSLRIAIEDAD